mgnify:FL=1
MDEGVNIEENVTQNKTDNESYENIQDVQCSELANTNESAHTRHDVITCADAARLEKRRNLPGLQTTYVDMDMGDQHMEPPKAKKIKLSPGHGTTALQESLDNQEIGKRKRIQHDYRRLSSSGYLDDYETNRERFSSDSDTSPGLKVKPASVTQNDNPEAEETPHVKLTLKLSKTENGTFINGSGTVVIYLSFKVLFS